MKKNKIIICLLTFIFLLGFSVVSFAKEDSMNPLSYENAFDVSFNSNAFSSVFPYTVADSSNYYNLMTSIYDSSNWNKQSEFDDFNMRKYSYVTADVSSSYISINYYILVCSETININNICYVKNGVYGNLFVNSSLIDGKTYNSNYDYIAQYYFQRKFDINTFEPLNKWSFFSGNNGSINDYMFSAGSKLIASSVPIYSYYENGGSYIGFDELNNNGWDSFTDLRGSRKAEQSSANHLYLPSCNLKFITNSSGANASGREHDLIHSTSVSLLVDYGCDVWQSLNKADYSIEITCTPFANNLALTPVIREYAFNGNYVLESAISLGLGNYSYKLYNDSVTFDSISYRLCSPSLTKDEKIVVSVVLIDKDGCRSGAFSKTFRSGFITDTTDTSILDNTNPYIKGDDETIDYNQVVTGGSSGSVSNGITINNSIVNNSNGDGIEITWSPEDKDSAEHVTNGIKNGFGLLDRNSDVFKLFRDLLGVLPAPILLIVGGSLSCVTVITIVKIIRG